MWMSCMTLVVLAPIVFVAAWLSGRYKSSYTLLLDGVFAFVIFPAVALLGVAVIVRVARSAPKRPHDPHT